MVPRPRGVAPPHLPEHRRLNPGRFRRGGGEDTLPLLVLGNLGAHHVQPSFALDDPAVLAELLDCGADLWSWEGRT